MIYIVFSGNSKVVDAWHAVSDRLDISDINIGPSSTNIFDASLHGESNHANSISFNASNMNLGVWNVSSDVLDLSHLKANDKQGSANEDITRVPLYVHMVSAII